MYKIFVKRLLDICFSLVLIIVLLPIMFSIYIAILYNMGTPVIFKHQRPGKNGRIFTMYKFRSMKEKQNDSEGDLERITNFGKFLRSTSLDELPEIFNVLFGDMSLVGPRPLLIEYLDKYSINQFRRHDVLPGITGLAQIKGRNNLSWRNKFRYDVFYVDHLNILLDISIIFETLRVVVKKENFQDAGEETKFSR